MLAMTQNQIRAWPLAKYLLMECTVDATFPTLVQDTLPYAETVPEAVSKLENYFVTASCPAFVPGRPSCSSKAGRSRSALVAQSQKTLFQVAVLLAEIQHFACGKAKVFVINTSSFPQTNGPASRTTFMHTED
jgi:hypothetical protein